MKYANNIFVLRDVLIILQKIYLSRSSCGDGIYEGEEYIENQYGEYRHYECFHEMKDMVDWLGYEVKIMED